MRVSRWAVFGLTGVVLLLLGLALTLPRMPFVVDASQTTPTPPPFPPKDSSSLNHHDKAKLADRQQVKAMGPVFDQPCVDGFAAEFPCRNVDLLSFLPIGNIGGGQASSSWGWTDPDTRKEYALVGRSNGTSFVDITDPINPVYIGTLPSYTGDSAWRELKTYGYYALIVSDANGNHGMQIFDLRNLRNVANPPRIFSETTHYGGFGNGHTITLNADSGYVFVNGTNTCSGGLHMVNMSDPLNPTFAGCFAGDGYSHDSQCVTYHGPDTAYSNHEICFNSNEDSVTVVDVTNKNAPVQLARKIYLDFGYVHQGWLTPDQQYFVQDDEFDEADYAHTAYSYIWNVRDLNKPKLIGTYKARFRAIDHNQYIKGDRIYQANYRAGLRVLDATNVANGKLREVGFFDVYPADDNPNFNGAWNVYPFHSNGVVTISGIEQGLFVVQPQPEADPPPCPVKPGGTPGTSPANGAVVNTPKATLGWAANQCASKYKVVLRENNAKGAVVARVRNVQGLSYTTGKLTKNKTYWWRVMACNAWGCGKGAGQTFRIQ